jgi:hypothetical protein
MTYSYNVQLSVMPQVFAGNKALFEVQGIWFMDVNQCNR